MIYAQHKTKILTAILVAFTLFATAISIVSANTVVRTGEKVSLSEDQTVEGDFYAAGGTVNLSGVIEQDAVVAGGEVTLNGTVNESVFLIGGSADVHGPVGDDLRIISGETTIAEPVAGDLFVIGGKVEILSTASIGGDILLYAGEAIIEGPVGGDILGTVGSLRIDSDVAGKIDIIVTELTLGDRANIQGSIRYVSTQLAVQALNATVHGDLVRSDPVIPSSQSPRWTWLIPSLMLLFATLAWHLVSRQSLNAVAKRAMVKSPRPIMYGFAALFFIPVAIVILFVSMIGTFVAIIFLLGYLQLLVFGLVGAVAVLGQVLSAAFNKHPSAVSLLSIMIGIVGFTLLSLLPIVGQAILIICVILTMGAIIDTVIRLSHAKGG